MLTIFRLRVTFIKTCLNIVFASFIIINFCKHGRVYAGRLYGYGNNFKTIYRPYGLTSGLQQLTQQTMNLYGGNRFGYLGNSGILGNSWRNNGLYSSNLFGNSFLNSPNNLFTRPNSNFYAIPSISGNQGSIIDVTVPPNTISNTNANTPVVINRPITNPTVTEAPVITTASITTVPQESVSEEGQVVLPEGDSQTANIPAEYNIEIPADIVENTGNAKEIENSKVNEPSYNDEIKNHESIPTVEDVKVDQVSETDVRIPGESGENEEGKHTSNTNSQENIYVQNNQNEFIETAENPNQNSNVNSFSQDNEGNQFGNSNDSIPPVQVSQDNEGNQFGNSNDSIPPVQVSQDNEGNQFGNSNDSITPVQGDKISKEDENIISNFYKDTANDKISNEDDSLIANFFSNSTEEKSSTNGELNEKVSTEDNLGIQENTQNTNTGEIPKNNVNSSEDDNLIANFLTNSTNESSNGDLNQNESYGENHGIQENTQNTNTGDIPKINNNDSNDDDSIIATFLAYSNDGNSNDGLNENVSTGENRGMQENTQNTNTEEFPKINNNYSNEDDSLIATFLTNSTDGNSNDGLNENVSTGENRGMQENTQNTNTGEIPKINTNYSNEDDSLIATFLTNSTNENNFTGGQYQNNSDVETSDTQTEETGQQSLPDYTDIFDIRFNIKGGTEASSGTRTNERRIVDSVCGIPGVTPDVGAVDKTSLLPWLVTLGTGNSFDFNFLCGGTIISKSIVLSSAHCFHQELPTVAKIGDLYLPVEKIKIHENYNMSRAYNNIALIKLSSPVNSTTLEACLPRYNSTALHDANGLDSSALEWKVSKTGDLAKPEISVSKILPNSHCIKAYEKVDYENYFPHGFDSTLLCVKLQQKSTYCRQGDSGVQLYHVNTDNIFTLIGTISDPEDRCRENNYPAIFTKVSAFASWIFDNALLLSQ